MSFDIRMRVVGEVTVSRAALMIADTSLVTNLRQFILFVSLIRQFDLKQIFYIEDS